MYSGANQLELLTAQLLEVRSHEMLFLFISKDSRLILFVCQISRNPRTKTCRFKEYHRWFLYDVECRKKVKVKFIQSIHLCQIKQFVKANSQKLG